MNIYIAIMKAADHIQGHPQDFRFSEIWVPTGCGTPGCALGWIGHFAGVSGHVDGRGALSEVEAANAVGIYPSEFYERMYRLCGGHRWRNDAVYCATGLRLYAEKYHGHEKPAKALIPDWQTIAASPLIPDHVRSEDAAHV